MGLQSSEGLIGAQQIALGVAPPPEKLLAGGLRSPTVGLSQLSFTTASDLRNRGRGNVFPDLASEVAVCYSYDFTAEETSET